MKEQHTLSLLQVPKCMGGEAKTCHEKTAGTVLFLATLSPHKSLQNTPVIPNPKTIIFLDCYMNAKSPEEQMSPSWEILRSITEGKGGTLEATGNFYSS